MSKNSPFPLARNHASRPRRRTPSCRANSQSYPKSVVGAAVFGTWTWFSAFCAGCSGDVVSMGSDEAPAAPPPEHSRCREQTTLSGSVVVNVQDDLAALEGCETIDGNLTIRNATNLRALHALKQVTGHFAYTPRYGYGRQAAGATNRPTTTLEGLESLERVGSLFLGGVATEDLQPLRSLRELTNQGDLTIVDCPNLRNLQGLENLEVIHSLVLSNAPLLETVAPMQLPSIMDAITFVRLPKLQDFGAQSLRVLSELTIVAVPMRDLEQFSSLQKVQLIDLEQDAELESLAYLGLIETKTLVLRSNPQLTLPPLGLRGLERLIVSDNAALTELELSTYTEVSDQTYYDGVFEPFHLEVSSNPALRRLTVPSPGVSAQTVRIAGNAVLENIEFGGLQAIATLTLTDNPSLRSVSLALETVDYLRVSGSPDLPAETFDGVRTFFRSVAPSDPAATP